MKMKDLGCLAANQISEFAINGTESSINELFRILMVLAKKISFFDLKGVDQLLVNETAMQVTEDVVALVHKNPRNYIHMDNFLWYFRSAIKKRSSSTLNSWLNNRVVYLDDVLKAELPTVEELTDRRDDVKIMILTVRDILSKTPRYNGNSRYLVWPVIFSLLKESKEMFDTLPYRDRIALRIVTLRSISESMDRIRKLC